MREGPIWTCTGTTSKPGLQRAARQCVGRQRQKGKQGAHQANFSAAMPATIITMPATRIALTGSANRKTAAMAVPTAPMPTQTA